MRTHPNVINEGKLEWAEQSHGERFGLRRKSLGAATGESKLGCSLYEIPPGRRAWLYHYHSANEEAIYVLEGADTLRMDTEEIEISKGDYIIFPAERETHQIINSSDRTLRYICFP